MGKEARWLLVAMTESKREGYGIINANNCRDACQIKAPTKSSTPFINGKNTQMAPKLLPSNGFNLLQRKSGPGPAELGAASTQQIECAI
jgi:hypothetical protein